VCFFGTFWQKKVHSINREIGLIVFCRIKLIKNNDYSPTNKSLFCLLKLLTTTMIQRATGEPHQSEWDKGLTLSQLICLLTISRGLSVCNTYRKDVKYNKIVERLSSFSRCLFIPSKHLLKFFLSAYFCFMEAVKSTSPSQFLHNHIFFCCPKLSCIKLCSSPSFD